VERFLEFAAISQEPEMPSVNPRPPMAMLKPPPMSAAAVVAVVCSRFMSRFAAMNDSLSLPAVWLRMAR